MRESDKRGICRIKRLRRQTMAALSVILFFVFSMKGMAEEVISVELPILTEEEGSPFDFVLDPYGLLYRTGAVKYGGGSVEEGATLLFQNRDGEYDFSGSSDFLTVINPGERPVSVTVTATLNGYEGMNLVPTDDFSGSGEPDIYLALADDLGNRQALSADGGVSICQEVSPGVWSVRLVGACNPDADWQSIASVSPKVFVTWHTEFVAETDGQAPDGEKDGGEKPEETGSREEEPEEPDSAEEDPEEPGLAGEEPEDSGATKEEPEDSSSTPGEAVEDPDSEAEKPEESTEDAGEGEDTEISVSGNDMAARVFRKNGQKIISGGQQDEL